MLQMRGQDRLRPQIHGSTGSYGRTRFGQTARSIHACAAKGIDAESSHTARSCKALANHVGSRSAQNAIDPIKEEI